MDLIYKDHLGSKGFYYLSWKKKTPWRCNRYQAYRNRMI